MSRVCILSAFDFSRMSMVSIYTEYLEKNGISYDFIYVDKFKDTAKFSAENYYPYHVDKCQNVSLPVKFVHYWKMRNFVKEILQKNSYEFIITWGELTAFLFADILSKNMPGRYCLNIRDYFYNRVPVVWWRLKTAISHAAFGTVSSEDYLNYLPQGEYIMMHSLNRRLTSELSFLKDKRPKDKPLRIMYLGLISRMQYVHKLIDELGGDERFELVFAGIGSEQVDAYIEGRNYSNIETYGRFPQEDTVKYLQKADILYNLYGCHNRHFDTALSIKLYYAIFMNMPILTFRGTHTNSVAEQCGIALTVDGEDFSNLGDKIYDAYYKRDLTSSEVLCRNYLGEVDKSHVALVQKLDELLMKG